MLYFMNIYKNFCILVNHPIGSSNEEKNIIFINGEFL